MRHPIRLAATGLAAVLAVSACGTTDVLHGKSASQIVQLASTSVNNGSYRMTMHGTISVDASSVTGLPPSAVSQISSLLKGATLDGTADVQSPQRLRVTMTMKPVFAKQVVMVLYDGAAYFSEDGGKTFGDAGSFDFSGLPASPADQVALLKDLGQTLQDRGSTTRNGVSVEDIHATLNNDYVTQLFSKLSAGSGQTSQLFKQLGPLFAQAVSLKDSTIDAFVGTADGRMQSSVSNITLSIDMGKLLGALAQAFGGQAGGAPGLSGVGGAMVLKEDVTATFSDYGAKISITKPTVDPNAPAFPGGGGGLFGA